MSCAGSRAAEILRRRLQGWESRRPGQSRRKRRLFGRIPRGQKTRARRENLALGRSLRWRVRRRRQARLWPLHLGRALGFCGGPLRGRIREGQAQRLRPLRLGERRQLRRAVEGRRGGGTRDADDDREIPSDSFVAMSKPGLKLCHESTVGAGFKEWTEGETQSVDQGARRVSVRVTRVGPTPFVVAGTRVATGDVVWDDPLNWS